MHKNIPLQSSRPFISSQPDLERNSTDYVEYMELISPSSLPILYYQFSIPATGPHSYTIVPGAHIDIVFHCSPLEPKATVFGTLLSSQEATFEDTHSTFFCIRLLPIVIMQHFLIPIKIPVNSHVPLEQLLPIPSEEIENISKETSFQNRVSLFKSILNRFSNPHFASPFMYTSLHIIHTTHGNVCVQDIAAELNRSTRYVHKLFAESIGISPKLFCQIVRFQYAMSRLLQSSSTTPLLDIISELGYFDQSHFITEFKRFTNNSPSRWIEQFKLK